MARPRSASSSSKLPARLWRGANLGFEAKLWAAADALRNNMDTDV
jgi:hypothetical protein